MSEHKLNPFARGTDVSLPAVVRDLYGRELGVGDQLILTVPSERHLFRVDSVAPVVDPTQPANLMDIVVVCRFKFRAVRDDANEQFYRVLAASELPQKVGA